ncbi:single-stranded DNA-binding protein [Phyllobacterium sp. LjRoot231]|uniref:single-stranded DNA-binding protein n=1 Tax=Phyllobacterium sp. LjRoot231 TaxID=3342289 RepID=UPI003ECC8018
MRSINRFTVNGNVGSVTSFEKAAKVNVATDRSWTNDAGEKQTKTDWVTVTILDERQAAWVVENVKKGQPVIAEGRIGNSSYEKAGQTVYSTDLIATIFNAFPATSDASE